jgi:hypothetical protein
VLTVLQADNLSRMWTFLLQFVAKSLSKKERIGQLLPDSYSLLPRKAYAMKIFL